MAEFYLSLRKKEVIKENTNTLQDLVDKGEINKEELLELLEIAESEEEYEVAISIKEVLEKIIE